MQIVKVKYRNNGEFNGREYSYFSEDTLKVGDIVFVPVKTGFNTAQVSAIDVPESEILPFKDAVKTIPTGSIIEPKKEVVPELFNLDLIPTVVKIKDEIVKLSNYAIDRVIKSDADLTPIGDDLILVSKLKKALKEKQSEYVNPIKLHLDKVQFVFKYLLTCLDDIEKTNKAKITTYTDAQKARAAKAERLNREAEELARKQAEFNGGAFTVDTTPIEAPAPVKKVSTMSGSFSEVKAPNTWELEDFDKVPNQYKILDTVRINQLVRAGGSIPGIKIITHTTIRTTTK